ncbi:MAG: hypothetical protein A2020_12350 [Lentisphaerae bacterium GWF2_45_14]|nr:MAG: hypothetical protein A2020_12350 [Lentisphaerae bacterium GWF2_45_14]
MSETTNERSKKFKERLECVLSAEEKQKKGQQLAETNQRKQSIDEQKKAISSDFKAKIDACDSSIGVLALAIQTGKEYREVECELHYNNPTDGIKTTYRFDTGETIRVEAMTTDEKQNLFINALGEQDNMFVFLDRKELSINYEAISETDRKEAEFQGWSLAYEGNDRDMVTYTLTDSFDYKLYKSGGKFSIYKRPVKKSGKKEKDAAPKKEPASKTAEDGSIMFTNSGVIFTNCEYCRIEGEFNDRIEELLATGWDKIPEATGQDGKDEVKDFIEENCFENEKYITLFLKDKTWQMFFRDKENPNSAPIPPSVPDAKPPTPPKSPKKNGKKSAAPAADKNNDDNDVRF